MLSGILRFSFFLSLLLTGCREVQPIQLIKIEGVRLGQVRNNEVQLFVDARISNPNARKIKIKSGEFDLMINNHSLGKTSINKALVIRGRGDSVYTLELTSRVGDLLKSGLSGLGGLLFEKKLVLRCSGWVRGSMLGVSKTVPLQYESELPVSELIKLKNLH